MRLVREKQVALPDDPFHKIELAILDRLAQEFRKSRYLAPFMDRLHRNYLPPSNDLIINEFQSPLILLGDPQWTMLPKDKCLQHLIPQTEPGSELYDYEQAVRRMDAWRGIREAYKRGEI